MAYKAEYDISVYLQDLHAYKRWTETDSTKHIQNLRSALLYAIEHELTEKQKLYINAYYVKGYNTQEIGDLYGVNRATVSRVLANARRRLYSRLKYCDPYFYNKLQNNKIYHNNRRRRNDEST